MAPIALLFSLGLSACLVVWDLRRRKSVSAAIWLPTLLVMMLGSRPVSMWLGGASTAVSEMGNNADRSPIDQIFYVVVLGGSLIIACSRRVNWGKLVKANAALMAFYLFFAVSVLWSDDPTGSLKRWIKDIGTIFVIAVVLTEKTPLEAIRAVYFRCAAVLFPLSEVFIRYYPSLGRSYSLGGAPLADGVTTQKNGLGEMVMVFCLFLIWDLMEARGSETKRKRIPWDRVGLLVIGLHLLYMSQSKTALVCLSIATVLLFRWGWLASRMVNALVLLGALSAPFLLFSMKQFSSIIAPVVEALGRSMTLTGRTDIWDHITSTTVNPVYGAGFWNFWGGEGGRAISVAMRTPVPNAHCGYLDIYLDGGMIGLFLLLCLLCATGQRLARTIATNRFQLLQFAFLIAMIFYNLSESTFARPSPSWFTMLLVTIAFPFRNLKTGSQEAIWRTAIEQSVKEQWIPSVLTQ